MSSLPALGWIIKPTRRTTWVRIKIVCNIINLRVYGDPAITVVAVLLQIIEAQGMGQGRGHSKFGIDERKSIERNNVNRDINLN